MSQTKKLIALLAGGVFLIGAIVLALYLYYVVQDYKLLGLATVVLGIGLLIFQRLTKRNSRY